MKNYDLREPAPGKAGSIEQELDMCERGPLRGDEVSRPKVDRSEIGVDRLMANRHDITMEEENREGDEMTGDDHSSGLQGGEPELENQSHIETGLPGDENFHVEREEAIRARRRMA